MAAAEVQGGGAVNYLAFGGEPLSPPLKNMSEGQRLECSVARREQHGTAERPRAGRPATSTGLLAAMARMSSTAPSTWLP